MNIRHNLTCCFSASKLSLFLLSMYSVHRQFIEGAFISCFINSLQEIQTSTTSSGFFTMTFLQLCKTPAFFNFSTLFQRRF
ncbi:hypothetical protein CW304_11940 [Bacillus sp. UFRGS-B20]|nr:hypothetical protein CW304_11940 [Bacillus sp. UFRGS-B20]